MSRRAFVEVDINGTALGYLNYCVKQGALREITLAEPGDDIFTKTCAGDPDAQLIWVRPVHVPAPLAGEERKELIQLRKVCTALGFNNQSLVQECQRKKEELKAANDALRIMADRVNDMTLALEKSPKLKWIPYVHGVTEIPEGYYFRKWDDGSVGLGNSRAIGGEPSESLKYVFPIILPPDPVEPVKDEAEEACEEKGKK